MKVYKEKTKIGNLNLNSPLRLRSVLQRRRDLIDIILSKRNASPNFVPATCSVV